MEPGPSFHFELAVTSTEQECREKGAKLAKSLGWKLLGDTVAHIPIFDEKGEVVGYPTVLEFHFEPPGSLRVCDSSSSSTEEELPSPSYENAPDVADGWNLTRAQRVIQAFEVFECHFCCTQKKSNCGVCAWKK